MAVIKEKSGSAPNLFCFQIFHRIYLWHLNFDTVKNPKMEAKQTIVAVWITVVCQRYVKYPFVTCLFHYVVDRHNRCVFFPNETIRNSASCRVSCVPFLVFVTLVSFFGKTGETVK